MENFIFSRPVVTCGTRKTNGSDLSMTLAQCSVLVVAVRSSLELILVLH